MSTNPEKEILTLALGDPQCDNSTTSKAIDRLAIPLVGTLLFLILSLPSLDAALAPYVPSFYYRLVLKALIFLIVLYILDRAITCWRQDNEICD